MVKNISSSSASLPLSEVLDRINTEENFAEFHFLFEDYDDFNEPDKERYHSIQNLLECLDITPENYVRNKAVTYSSSLCFTNEIKQWAVDSIVRKNYLVCFESEFFPKFEALFLNDYGVQHMINILKNGGVKDLTIQIQATAWRYFANKVLRLISDQGGL